jgi:broad specificity phosphatase PhoE
VGFRAPVEIRDEPKNRTRRENADQERDLGQIPAVHHPAWHAGEMVSRHPESGQDLYDRIDRLATEPRSLEGTHERILVVSHAWPLDALTSVLGPALSWSG